MPDLSKTAGTVSQKPGADQVKPEDAPVNYDKGTKSNPSEEDKGAVAPLDRDLPKRAKVADAGNAAETERQALRDDAERGTEGKQA